MADPKENRTKTVEMGAESSSGSRCFPGGMHDNVPDWSDPVCSCEAEPYWEAIAEQEEDRATPGEEEATTTSAPSRGSR